MRPARLRGHDDGRVRFSAGVGPEQGGRSSHVQRPGTRPRMLRLTARYADAWNTAWYSDPDKRLTQQLADMRDALDAEGREPATLRRTVGFDCALTEPDALARRLDAYDELGIDDVIIGFEPITREKLDLVAAATALRNG
ncbi:LLM class flavin-dependent oxidoreductase [Actinoplanes sp. NPDC026619]|uniref:LLM class flavin-dependent oxidoreductase n=1 Tax=Actinoplanes sp. NPDC026619 TaxID=3155798 RepID=UPI0033FDB371